MFWKKKTIKSMKPEGHKATELLFGFAAANRQAAAGNPIFALDTDLLEKAYLAFIVGVVSQATKLWEYSDVEYMAFITALFLNHTDMKPEETNEQMNYIHSLAEDPKIGIAGKYGMEGIDRFLEGSTKGLSKKEHAACCMYFEAAMLEIYKERYNKER